MFYTRIYKKNIVEFIRPLCTQVRSRPTSNKLIGKVLGQPTNDTHPHILNEGEVTPMTTKYEYETRRTRLVEAITKYSFKNTLRSKNHLVSNCNNNAFKQKNTYFNMFTDSDTSCFETVYV